MQYFGEMIMYNKNKSQDGHYQQQNLLIQWEKLPRHYYCHLYLQKCNINITFNIKVNRNRQYLDPVVPIILGIGRDGTFELLLISLSFSKVQGCLPVS